MSARATYLILAGLIRYQGEFKYLVVYREDRGIILINIRILNEKGSETIQVTREEATKTITEHLENGFLIVNDDTKEQINDLGEVENVLLIPPMAGG